MMNKRRIVVAIGAVVLTATTLANAGGLDDFFGRLPHAQAHGFDRDRDDHQEMFWHRDDRGFGPDAEYRLERDRSRDEHRFTPRRHEHPRFFWHDHDRR